MSKKNKRAIAEKQDGSSPDSSPHVYQRDKLKDSLDIKDLNWTEKQKEFIRIALDKNTKVMMVTGPAGSSKSLLSVYAGLHLLNQKKVSDIVYVRSAVESSDSKLGYLPGDVNEKLMLYNLPFYDKMAELLPKSQVNALQEQKRVSCYPIGFARGMSWNAKCIIFDECQNSSMKEIITLLTRLGEFTKCFILADPDQTDLYGGKGGGFKMLYTLFSDEESQVEGIRTFQFEEDDIMRSRLVRYMVKKFKYLPPLN